MKFLRNNPNGPLVMAILSLAVLAFSFFAGAGIGRLLLSHLVTGRDTFAFLLSRPAREFVVVSRLVNSDSELSRLAGYYGLLENEMIDTAFLKERLASETTPVVRRTIIWVLGFSRDSDEALEVLNSVYKNAGDSLKQDILHAMRRLDEKYYNDFIQEKGQGGK